MPAASLQLKSLESGTASKLQHPNNTLLHWIIEQGIDDTIILTPENAKDVHNKVQSLC
jgi:hypothetical protein